MFNYRSPLMLMVIVIVTWLSFNYDSFIYRKEQTSARDTGILPITKTPAKSLPKPSVRNNETHSPALAERISKNYKHISKDEAKYLIRLVYKETKTQRVNPVLVLGLIGAESSFKKNSLSPVGAVGYTQVLPRWHADKIKDRDIAHPSVNVQVGVKILSDCMKKRKNERGALACYNGATSHVDVEKYVRAVYSHMKNIERFNY